jgi:hypothetical protein
MDAATVSINGVQNRHVIGECDVEELCQSLRALPSFALHVRRPDGVELDVYADANGATAFYLDMTRGVKLTSIDPSGAETDILRMRVDALPDVELEIERRHIVPREKALVTLRRFLNQGIPEGMAPWPGD